MFEEGTKITLFVLFLAVWIVTLVAEQTAPRAELTTEVDVSLLPLPPARASRDGSPAQTRVSERRVALGSGFEAKLLYGYVIEGLVVTRREFRFDPTSAVSPLDLGIVWGDLAEPGGIASIEFTTAPRAVWSTPAPGAVLPADWDEQVTNNHLVPANRQVSDALMAIEVGNHVRLRGFLVEVTGERISPWRSSTRRDDSTIVGGCEIILVTGVEVLAEAPDAA